MRHAFAVLALTLLLAACGKPAGHDDQPAAPSEPASAPASTPAVAAPSDADKTAALATLPAAYQGADLDNGQARFAVCKSCHTAIAGGGAMTGPNLYGVFGRKAGSSPGFSYSDGLKSSGIVWDADHLDKWIADPRAVVASTKMTFLGVKDPKDRRDLIAYLKVATTAPAKS